MSEIKYNFWCIFWSLLGAAWAILLVFFIRKVRSDRKQKKPSGGKSEG